MGSLRSTLTNPPKALRKVTLDNIALVPASLLPLKHTYQPLANRLPKGSVLCVQTASSRQKRILQRVAQFFRKHGHVVIHVPIEKVTQPKKRPLKQTAPTLQLAL